VIIDDVMKYLQIIGAELEII